MRTVSHLRLPPLMLIILISLLSSCAVRKYKDSAIRGLIESGSFKFSAQFATPMGGRQIHLTGPYELVVSERTITSFLPYYGVAYRAPMGSDENGIKFTSEDFRYNVSARKSGWNIQIRPQDQQEVRALNLRVSSSGMATLQVTSTYRQSISYSGRIVPVSEKTW